MNNQNILHYLTIASYGKMHSLSITTGHMQLHVIILMYGGEIWRTIPDATRHRNHQMAILKIYSYL